MSNQEDHRRFTGRLFNFANNPITIVGAGLTTISAILIITFLIVEVFGELDNPYIGIFAYVFLPAIFGLGLVISPVGMLLRRRALIRDGASEAEKAQYPTIDFNNPGTRRFAVIVVSLTAINAVIFGASSFIAVEKMESVEFCGEACHTVMQPEYAAYQQSPHSRVACVECHIGPGASWFVKSKLDGLRQVWHTALDSYPRPVGSPLQTLRPARETCEQCHWPGKHHGDKLKTFAHFATDEDNSPSYTAILLKTGGGSRETGQHGGIHWWHIESDNVIRYVGGDDRRETIRWVELTTPDDEVRIYSREGEDPLSDSEIDSQARTMDCIDCHNRPTHYFLPPGKAIDELLSTHPEVRKLPFFKREAKKAVEAEYETHAAGLVATRSSIIDFYRREYPDGDRELIEVGAELASRAYARIAFPEMNTNWETHPNHLGHDDSPGCWRCHDDEMATADGDHVIPMDCENCHIFLVEDAPEPPDFGLIIAGS